MTTISKRELIKQAYPHNKKWSARVDKMSEGQVTAIFLRLRRENKI